MPRSNSYSAAEKRTFRRHGARIMAYVGAAIFLAGATAGCPANPCVDGTQSEDEAQVSIKLINDSSNPIHLIGEREEPDPCNRVAGFGGTRFIFALEGRVGYTVRAFSEGVFLGDVTCALPEESTVRYTDSGALTCTQG